MIVSLPNGPRWSPGIGDPSSIAWVSVVGYGAAALLCLWAARRDIASRRWWATLAALMLFLGINKQLDLQSLLTQTGRDLAKAEGWYEVRQWVQLIFVVALAVGGLIGVHIFVRTARHRSSGLQVALAGCVLLGVFVLLRAASFHHVDRLIGLVIAGARLNTILELGGITIVASGAILALRRSAARAVRSTGPNRKHKRR